MKTGTRAALESFLTTRGIPYFSFGIVGLRVKVITLREEYAARWVDLLGKIADVDPVKPTTAREKKRKGDFYQPPAVPAYEVTAVIKKGASHEPTA